MTDAITWDGPDGEHPARRASRRSMAAVAAGRKDEWLALFAPDASIRAHWEPNRAMATLTGVLDVTERRGSADARRTPFVIDG